MGMEIVLTIKVNPIIDHPILPVALNISINTLNMGFTNIVLYIVKKIDTTFVILQHHARLC